MIYILITYSYLKATNDFLKHYIFKNNGLTKVLDIVLIHTKAVLLHYCNDRL